MSNTQSKQVQMIECYDEHEYVGDTYSDKLVLKLEEVDVGTGEIRFKCFVAYDHNEGEYFICGKSMTLEDDREPEDFKFYCKSRKNTMSFLKYLFQCPQGTEQMNHVLFNYKYLGDYECVDYWVLEEHEDALCELAGFDGATYNKSWLSPLLKTLKYVRY